VFEEGERDNPADAHSLRSAAFSLVERPWSHLMEAGESIEHGANGEAEPQNRASRVGFRDPMEARHLQKGISGHCLQINPCHRNTRLPNLFELSRARMSAC
jgi:hypothetical protein